MNVIPMLVLLGPAHPFDGEDALRVAQQFLSRMGVPKAVGLQGLTEIPANPVDTPGKKAWGVAFNLPNNEWITVNVDDLGKVYYACSSGMKGGGVPNAPADRARGQRLMARVPDAIPVKQDPQDSFCFRAVVDGRTYFNMNPTYGYRIHFNDKGNLLWFGRQDRLPTPAARTTKIAKDAAIQKLTSAWKGSHPSTWPYPRYIEADLGYYHRKGEPTARLVYRGTIMSTFANSAHEMGRIKTFVDAVDGSTFEADDQ